MKRKGLAITCLVAGLSVLTSMTAFAGQWLTDDTGWWYQNDDGSYLQNGWHEIDGKQYYFQPDGYILRDTITPDGYVVDTDGSWLPEGAESEAVKRQKEAASRFVDVSKYFNTDLQDYEKAKVILGVRPYEIERGMWYETRPNGIENIKQIAYAAPSSLYNENSDEYYKQSTFRINYDVNTNQIVSINGQPDLFVSGAPRKDFWASKLKTIAEEAGATDIVYENNDEITTAYGLAGNTIVEAGKELLHRDSVTFTWNNLKYSYTVKERFLSKGLSGIIISRN